MKRDLRALVERAFRREPTAKLGDVAERLGVSIPSVHYHVQQLERDGKIQRKVRAALCRNASQCKRLATRKANWKRRGFGALPRMSKSRQAELIERVVAKAAGSGQWEVDSGQRDVIRVDRAPFLRLKCHRIG
jgi:DNA-binding Lrp family transcriptional regulator